MEVGFSRRIFSLFWSDVVTGAAHARIYCQRHELRPLLQAGGRAPGAGAAAAAAAAAAADWRRGHDLASAAAGDMQDVLD